MLPLSDHASFEMDKRGIPETEVRQVFDQPQQKIQLANQREVWQSKVELDGQIYLLRLIVDLQPVLRIVTVYRTSKLAKYWKEDS